jgi:uncharacterized membrane protein YedE/YeeE
MMFETLGLENFTAREASVMLGLLLGLVFGALAQRSRFCLRRGLVGPAAERSSALGVWLIALAVGVLSTQAAVAAGLIDFTDHRFLTADLPVLAILAGGALFGAGMVLTKGCVSRLTVLTGQGNLRALLVLVVFAITAHATLKGVLAPLRVSLGSVTLPLGEYASLSALPGGAVWALVIAGLAFAVAARSGARPAHLVMAAMIGLLVTAGWVGTGFVLFDDFDPIAMESLSFTSPASETLFWTIASSAIPAGFGTGLVGGVIIGSAIMALIFKEFRFESFEAPAQTGRYLTGAVMMGTGGVLAGGCSVGAGLAGVPTLGASTLLAIAAIATGALVAQAVLSAKTPHGTVVPAE